MIVLHLFFFSTNLIFFVQTFNPVSSCVSWLTNLETLAKGQERSEAVGFVVCKVCISSSQHHQLNGKRDCLFNPYTVHLHEKRFMTIENGTKCYAFGLDPLFRKFTLTWVLYFACHPETYPL